MRYPQLLIVDPDQRLAGLLRDLAKQHQWSLREPRSAEACLRSLRQSGTGVVVMSVGQDPKAEMHLLERCGVLFPDVPTVVVTDSDSSALVGLAWDLGAHFIFGPGQPREHLPLAVTSLMENAAGLIGGPAPALSKETVPETASKDRVTGE
jgi:DNA-binding NtrC family response regulator